MNVVKSTWNIAQKTRLANLALEMLMSVSQARVVTAPASMNYWNIAVTVPILATRAQTAQLTLTNAHLTRVTRETALTAQTTSRVSVLLDTTENVVMYSVATPRRLTTTVS